MAKDKAPAAENVRMSTEHQQYSLETQSAAIQKYAELNGFQVVRTADSIVQQIKVVLHLQKEFREIHAYLQHAIAVSCHRHYSAFPPEGHLIAPWGLVLATCNYSRDSGPTTILFTC
jgi:hypothetical protein